MTGPWIAAAVLASSVQTPAEPLQFESSVESVYVDAFVTHKGKPVRGLTAENFEVRDNGVLQEARLVSLDLVPVTLFLVFDTSSSVAGATLDQLRAAGRAALDGLRAGDRAALVTFDHEILVRVPPTDDLDKVGRVLGLLQGRGSTALYDATYASLVLPEQGGRSVILLFSDGEDNASWLMPEDVRSVASRSDVLLQAVAVDDTVPIMATKGSGARNTLGGGTVAVAREVSGRRDPSPRAVALQRIAESTGGRFWRAEKVERLEKTFRGILEELRFRYLLAFEPTGVERSGEHRLDVRLKGAKGSVRARTGYDGGSLR